MNPNIDTLTVEGFGYEWKSFDQTELSAEEREQRFAEYFEVFPWEGLPPDPIGFDLGCGSGRWAACVAPKVGTLHCIDASDAALAVAKSNLRAEPNCVFHHASVESIPLENGSMDFGYSLGVLHHLPDTEAGMRACVEKLKPGAPFLVYVYYAFDNRPFWFRAIWRMSDLIRRSVSRWPHPLKRTFTNLTAAFVYFPLARTARLLEKLGMKATNVPLHYYRDLSFYTMKTDAFDRFGTRLEHRYTADQIRAMMSAAGLDNIRFGSGEPYWRACGTKRP